MSKLVPSLLAATFLLRCSFDKSDRWESGAKVALPICEIGQLRCSTGVERCEQGLSGPQWIVVDDCGARGLVCTTEFLDCRPCDPGTSRCNGATVETCDATGQNYQSTKTCDESLGLACRDGACSNLCGAAAERLSNVGCEYWAVDLDNANVGISLNAAAQQYAVVVSNPEPDVSAQVSIEQDDTLPGESGAPTEVAVAIVPPLSLRVFKLGPREVDGSPPGEFNTGTNTALVRGAYRVKSSVPVVIVQFNPLENVNVFSNDASLLKPVEALTVSDGAFSASYVVLGWPQTIASTDDPNTNFSPSDPIDLRAFLTIVGTRDGTHVRVDTTTRVLGGGPVPDTPKGGSIEMDLAPFDVLNLETDDFNADFTGSTVWANQPVVVFSGSEASDAPFFTTLADRRCCADHLEQQLDPVRTAGKHFVASVSANRTRAVSNAGGAIGVVDQPEYFRLIAATLAGAHVTTTLASKKSIELGTRGDWVDLVATHDFMIESDQPVMLASVSASQDAAGVPRGLPGGDPSFLVIPPIEQFRASYVFLTPDKYFFDFLRIVAPADATVVLDDRTLDDAGGCTTEPADGLSDTDRGGPPTFVVHLCQLSFPVIDPTLPSPDNLKPGIQNDGVHRIEADQKVGVLVDGFDSYVSYAYAAGTELQQIVPR